MIVFPAETPRLIQRAHRHGAWEQQGPCDSPTSGLLHGWLQILGRFECLPNARSADPTLPRRRLNLWLADAGKADAILRAIKTNALDARSGGLIRPQAGRCCRSLHCFLPCRLPAQRRELILTKP